MTPSTYMRLLRLARRHSRRAVEAEDLLQNALLAAVACGRSDIDRPVNSRWLSGVIRKSAAFAARGAARRGRRDTQWQNAQSDVEATEPLADVADILRDLPIALKMVAALALSGHDRREIAYLLALNDATLRQRIAALKRRLAPRGIGFPSRTPGLTLDLAYGRIRTALKAQLLKQGGVFASHDPDGHLIIFARSQGP